MKTGFRGIVAFLAVLVLTASARAQHLLNVMPRAYFNVPAIQRELKLSPEQADRAEWLAKLMWDRMSQASEELRRAGGSQEARKAFKEKSREIERAYEKDLAAVLDPVQMKRLREINLQRRGVYAFTASELQDELKLSADQRAKFEEMVHAKVDRSRAMSKLRKDRSEESRAEIKKLMERDSGEAEEIRSLLDDEQKKAWSKMVGEPFDAM